MPADIERARAFNLQRLNRIAAVEAGALETVDELLSGFPHAFESAERSCQQWIDLTIGDIAGRPTFFDHTKLVEALQALRVRFDPIRLKRVIKIAEEGGNPEMAQRCLIYLGLMAGQHPTRLRVAAMCMSEIKSESMMAPFYLATAIGLVVSQRAESMAAARNAGFKSLSTIHGSEDMLRAASKSPEPIEADLDEDEHAAFLEAVAEDRAEYFGAGTPDSPLRFRKKQQRPGAVVVPAYELLPTTGRDDRQRAKRDMQGIAGKRLPFVLTGDVAAHMTALVERAPHLHDLFEAMLVDTALSPHLHLRPWLLVGPPGCGKSWAIRQFAEVVGAPVSIFDAGSSADSVFAGTPAQWSSTGVNAPLQLINESGTANPIMGIDEIDKAASSPHNGSLHSALLNFLDPGSAAQYRDPALELAVDVSHVNYILTANNVGSVPAPLRDRCRIVRVPNPGPEHVGVLVKRIVDDIARKRGIDPRWEPPLDPDEVEIVKEMWGGGSIRRLAQVVQSALNFRSQNFGRC